jgi:serine/threonine protein kinase
MGSAGAIRSDFTAMYDVAEQLGFGSASSVYRAKSKVVPAAISCGDGFATYKAVKIYSRESAQGEMSELALRESKFLLAAQRHPNIVGYCGLFNYIADDGHLGWAMSLELCAQGDLYDRIVAKGVLGEQLGAEVLFGISLGLSHLHVRGIVHRDVKSENILMADGARPVLADFGIAAHVDDAQEMHRRCGSPGYVPPEVLAGDKYGVKVDIFAVGVTLYFCLSGKMPFTGSDICSTLRRTQKCRVNLSLEEFAEVSVNMKTTLSALLQKNPDVRPTSSAAARHIYELYSSNFQEETLKRLRGRAYTPKSSFAYWSEDSSRRTPVDGTEDDFFHKPQVPQAPPTKQPFWRRPVPLAEDSDGVKRQFSDEQSREIDHGYKCEEPQSPTLPVSSHTLGRIRPLSRK